MIAITGASGFIGSHFLEAIRQQGIPFLCLYRKSQRGNALGAKVFPARQVDFGSQESLNVALKDCTTLVHMLGVINADVDDLLRINVEYTRRLIEAAKVNGIKKIIFMSSVAAIRRHGPYGESKYLAEEIVRNSGIPFFIVRPAFIYGTRDGNNLGMMIRTIKDWPVIPLLGGGNFMLQPVYVKDVVDLMLKMLALPGTNRAYSVAGPEQVSLKDILVALAMHLKHKRWFIPIPLKPIQFLLRGYIRIFPKTRLPAKQILELDKHEAFDIEETRATFGFNPIPFKEGIAKTFQESPCAV